MDYEFSEEMDSPKDIGTSCMDIAKRWQIEISLALQREKQWRQDGQKVYDRYLREKSAGQLEDSKGGENFSVLWSNVQNMKPSIYSQTPKPMVYRRFMDKDPKARIASELLERNLEYRVQPEYFDDKAEACVLDYLLPGRAQLWHRYKPHHMTERVELEVEMDPETGEQLGYIEKESRRQINATDTELDILEDEETKQPYYETSRLIYEEVLCEHLHWKDYLQSAGADWESVGWVARKLRMRKDAIAERFDDPAIVDGDCLKDRGDKSAADLINYEYTSGQAKDELGERASEQTKEAFKRADIWEIWDRESKTVYWISPGCKYLLDKEEDPLGLEGFFPCPKPLLTTIGPDSMIPVPDFLYYEKQADYIDELTHRKHLLTEALRVVGVCPDEHQETLARLVEETDQNEIIPVKDWPRFMQDGGLNALIQFFPLEVIANTLKFTIELIESEKAQLYEVSGMSDIVRGMTDPRETAAAQKTKANYANNRFRDKQMDGQRFFRDSIAIMGEIIAEKFQPDSLVEIANMMPEPPKELEEPMPPMPPAQTPEDQQKAQQMMQMQQQKRDAAMKRFQKEQEDLMGAIQLLKDQNRRVFRIDIETDSTIEADQEQEKQGAVEFLQAVGQFGEGFIKMSEAAPPFAKFMGNTLLFAARRFRAGRILEGDLEEAIEAFAEMKSQGGQQPNPQMMQLQMKAQAEQANMQMKVQSKQAELQMKAQEGQAKLSLEKEKMIAEHQRKIEEIYLEHEREMQELAIKEQERKDKNMLDAVEGIAKASQPTL